MAEENKTVLVCDDSMLIRAQLRDFIQGLNKGITVVEASDGVKAVEMYRQHRPRLVLLDIVMPNEDGLECLKQIKEMDPDANVVIVSSSGTKQILKEALQAGAVDFIQKPWSEELVAKIIDRVFG